MIKNTIFRLCEGCNSEKFMKVSSTFCSECESTLNPIGMKVKKVGGGGIRRKKLPSQRIKGISSPLLGKTKKPGVRRFSVGKLKSSKTHCPKGHEYSSQNTYITPEGWRKCKECKKVSDHRKYLRKKEKRANDINS